MKKVQILLSSYNGEANIRRQIESILAQVDVYTSVLVRDDHSKDATVEIVRQMQKEYPDRIELIEGENKGWKQSFMSLIECAGIFDYYGFSDQDDLWMPDKVKTCIALMEADKWNGIKLAHCNALSVEENLTPRKEQEYRCAEPISHKAAIVTEVFQGCGMVWNYDAMAMVKKHMPKNHDIAHDFWVGLVSYFFGRIYFTKEAKFYHIRYAQSSSADGNVKKGRMIRFKKLFSLNECMYMNPAEDLLEGYQKFLTADDSRFLSDIVAYRYDLRAKMQLLMDADFRRPTVSSTVLLKLAIIMNRY